MTASATATRGTVHATDSMLSPLPGELGIPDVARPPRAPMSRKGLLAAALMALSLIAACVLSIARLTRSHDVADDAPSKRAADRPAIATGEPRKLDLSSPSFAGSSPGAGIRIPVLVSPGDDTAEPIGVHRTGQASSPPAPAGRAVLPEDAPVMLMIGSTATAAPATRHATDDLGATTDNSAGPPGAHDTLAETRRNLQAYEQQLQALLSAMTAGGSAGGAALPRSPATGSTATGIVSSPAPGVGGNLFGGQLQKSSTPRVSATAPGDVSLTLPMGTAFTCALKTRVVSATSGFVSCLVQRNVFGADGRVLLIERGSQVDGEYRVTSLKPGAVRIPVLWTRIRAPGGVTVDIDSPGTGPLGESGVDGYVDNRWSERIGAALLLSLIDDSVQLALQHESSAQGGNAVELPATTSNSSKLAEKVLDSTINIPPLIYQNQGGLVGVYVARDVDFSSVYTLRPTAAGTQP